MRQKFQHFFLHFHFDAASAFKKNALLKRKKKKLVAEEEKNIISSKTN
jgi:hypothetical protein